MLVAVTGTKKNNFIMHYLYRMLHFYLSREIVIIFNNFKLKLMKSNAGNNNRLKQKFLAKLWDNLNELFRGE